MDQYSPASVTTSRSSIEISWFSYNRSSIVANRVYNITVSAISDARISYPSDPIIVSKFSCMHCLPVFTHILCTIVHVYIHATYMIVQMKLEASHNMFILFIWDLC